MFAVVDELAAVIPSLSDKDQVFANSLVTYATRLQRFSDKQHAFAMSLIKRAKTPAAAPIELGNFEQMLALFQHARLRSPKIHLWAEQEGEIVLALAGSRSQHEGTISVATPGGYGNNTYFGRIMKDGTFARSHRHAPSTSLIAIMQKFAADPLKVATEFGRKTGRCCFCNKGLDDPKSVALGYGPVCGKRWANR